MAAVVAAEYAGCRINGLKWGPESVSRDTIMCPEEYLIPAEFDFLEEYQRKPQLYPSINLVQAILERAWMDLFASEEIAAGVRRWIKFGDPGWIFSFENCCLFLDLNPDLARPMFLSPQKNSTVRFIRFPFGRNRITKRMDSDWRPPRRKRPCRSRT